MKGFMLLLMFCVNSIYSYGQRTATTEEGEIIYLDNDGTWRSVDDRASQPGVEENSACDFKVLERDQFVEEQWVVLQEEEIVAHTAHEFEDETRNKPFVSGRAYCAYVGGQYGIFFQWNIQTDSPDKQFGGLSEDAEVKLILEDVKPVTLEWVRTSEEKVDFEADETTYSNNTLLNQEQVKALKTHPVLKIGVQWDKKYVEYDFDNPAAFMSQFGCIESKL